MPPGVAWESDARRHSAAPTYSTDGRRKGRVTRALRCSPHASRYLGNDAGETKYFYVFHYRFLEEYGNILRLTSGRNFFLFLISLAYLGKKRRAEKGLPPPPTTTPLRRERRQFTMWYKEGGSGRASRKGSEKVLLPCSLRIMFTAKNGRKKRISSH